MEQQSVIGIVERVLRLEAEGIAAAADHLNEAWARAVHLILECQGKVVVLGIGKTGHVGQKIAASLSSLGTPSFFLHAAEAAHGDLGMLSDSDVVLAISNSGETAELTSHLDYIRELGCPLIALTRSAQSTLGRMATVCLEVAAEREADHLNLAPTVSSTLALAAGDALAVAMAEVRGFTRADFARRHPGGALGKVTRNHGD